MTVIGISNYMVAQAEKICRDKFNDDIMLILNNFTSRSINTITNIVKHDIMEIEKKGVVLDNKLVRIYCTMYLGLAWSMYRKGKSLCDNEKILSKLITNHNYKFEEKLDIVLNYVDNSKYKSVVDDLSLRYFSLYINGHISDMMMRMEIRNKTDIDKEDVLINVILGDLKKFGQKILSIGFIDEIASRSAR